MRLLLVLSVLLGVAPIPDTRAHTARTIALADFVDDSLDGVAIGASRLNAVLEQILSARAQGRLRVLPVEGVRRAMQAQGVTARDLVSPTRAIAVANAVGADWIVTGRWTHLERDDETWESPQGVPFRVAQGFGVLEIRVLEAATRRVVLEESFSGHALGPSVRGVLVEAAHRALLRAADGILKL